ncbi:MAG: metallophosphoesterase family protein [Flavobacteriales bacterium]|nr:metallophosphoesterase family protein [Flavobacteriales bacterium]
MRILNFFACLLLSLNLLAQDVHIIRGPYLQSGFTDKVTVCLRTDNEAQPTVFYGTDLTALTDSAKASKTGTDHEIDITGLQPNSKYFYEIHDGETVLATASDDLFFRTHPTSTKGMTVRGWVLGDCGTANDNQRAVRDAYYNHVGSEPTDMMLFLGDNAYQRGTDNEYQGALFENMYENRLKNTIAWSCIGNHDGYSAKSETQSGPYYDIFHFPTKAECGGTASGTEAYYSFDYGDVHFISLDSHQSDRSVGGAMYTWAENDLASTSAKWVIAFWHHPAYSMGSHNSDKEKRLVEMRENFVPLMEKYGVDVIFSGHSHSYERSYMLHGHYGNSDSFDKEKMTVSNGGGNGREDGDGAYQKTADLEGKGMVYLTAGSSGKISGFEKELHEAMLFSLNELGSCAFEIKDNRFDLKFIDNNGKVEDYFTLVKE